MTETLKRWLTPPQLAQQLGIEPPKIIAWINRGELRAANVADRVGGRPRWRISPDAVDEFLRPRESKAPPKPIGRGKARKNEVEQKYYL